MYCVKCGKILENNDRFCSGCGTVNPDFYSGQDVNSTNGYVNGPDITPNGQTVSPYMQPQNYQADVPPVYSPENGNALGFANAGTPVPPAPDMNGINGGKVKKKNNAAVIAGTIGALVLASFVAFGAIAAYNNHQSTHYTPGHVTEDYVPKEYTFNAMNNIKEPEVIWETDNVRVTTQNIVHRGSYSGNAELQLLIENKSGKELSIRTDSVTVNGVDIPNGNMYTSVPAGESDTDCVYLDLDILEKFKIDNINEIDLWFQVRDKANYDLIESSDKVVIETRNTATNHAMEDPDHVLYDQNNTKIAFDSIEYASRYHNDINVNMYLENTSDVTIDYEFSNVVINGNEVTSYKTVTLHPHTKTIFEYYFSDTKLGNIKVDDIDDFKIFQFDVTAKDSDTHQVIFKTDSIETVVP